MMSPWMPPHSSSSLTNSLVSLASIEAAAQRLRGVALRTPLLPVDALAADFPHGVWVKTENLQRVGAFKMRGAYNFVASMAPEARAKGLIAPSSGNHAQAVAYVAKHFGGLRAGALEDSNIDITAELVSMMTAQRAYQASAQSIKTQDQVLSTMLNMR